MRRNHSLRSPRNLPRTSGAKCGGNLKAAARFQHSDNVVDPYAFNKPEAGRGDIDCALGVVERIWFIGAARGQLSRELHRISSVSEFMGNPCPIALRIAVLSGTFTPSCYAGCKHEIAN